jgi:sulfur carrier protein ThiS
MRITAELKGSVKKLTLPEGSTIADLARRVGVYPDSAIFLVNDRISPSDDKITDGSKIRILPAASGG